MDKSSNQKCHKLNSKILVLRYVQINSLLQTYTQCNSLYHKLYIKSEAIHKFHLNSVIVKIYFSYISHIQCILFIKRHKIVNSLRA